MIDMSKKELETMGFRSIKENRCECDCMKGTCTDCFIRGKMKPWCTNCHNDINNGICNCDNQSKPYIKKGWIDVTPHIVKHNEEQKKEIHKRINAHNKFLEDAINSGNNMWTTRTCGCGKDFSTRGDKLKSCKTCSMKIFNDNDKYCEEDLKGAHYNF